MKYNNLLLVPVLGMLLTGCGNPAAPTQNRDTTSLSNLKQVGLATLRYAQDHDGKLPDTRSIDNLKMAVMPYNKSESIFLYPIRDNSTTRLVKYKINANISGMSIPKEIKEPFYIVLLYEANDDGTGGRNVLFVDGHVKWITEEALKEM